MRDELKIRLETNEWKYEEWNIRSDEE